jgi:hypothetical protein
VLRTARVRLGRVLRGARGLVARGRTLETQGGGVRLGLRLLLLEGVGALFGRAQAGDEGRGGGAGAGWSGGGGGCRVVGGRRWAT